MTQLAVLTRRAHSDDATALSSLYAEAWREAYAGIIPWPSLTRMIALRNRSWWRTSIDGNDLYLVLEVAGELAGYASYGPARWSQKPGVGEISEIYLKPVYQGIGFGGQFFSEVLRELGLGAFSTCLVRALTENERALAFYERKGGTIVARGCECIGGKRLKTVIYSWDL